MSRSNQAVGDHNTTMHDDLAAHDALPPSVARLVANAPLKISSESVLQNYRIARADGMSDKQFEEWLRPEIKRSVRSAA